MALFDNGFSVSTGLVIGIGALILAPVVVPVLAVAAKPLMKAGLKGGILLYEKGQEMIAEAQELFEDLAAEVKAELYDANGIVVGWCCHHCDKQVEKTEWDAALIARLSASSPWF